MKTHISQRKVLGSILHASVFTLIFMLLVATVAFAKAGDTKPFKATGHTTVAETITPSQVPEGFLTDKIAEKGYPPDLAFYREQEEINNVGGKSTVVAYELIYFTPTGGIEWYMARTVTTANGDELYEDLWGTASFIDPDTLRLEGEWVVTGGSGRFEGASGSGDVSGFATLHDLGSTYTLIGRISTVGSLKKGK